MYNTDPISSRLLWSPGEDTYVNKVIVIKKVIG
jgi:hypothetical protein